MLASENMKTVMEALLSNSQALHYLARHGASADGQSSSGFRECQSEECVRYKRAFDAASNVEYALRRYEEAGGDH